MADSDPKADLHHYLQSAREALLWKLDDLSESDVRRPLTPTGTNLLGLVKHVASIELGYFGDTFGRPSNIPLPWFEPGAEPNADLWATASEPRADIIDLYHRAWAHADVVRELVDGSAGLRDGMSNLPDVDEAWWESYRTRLQDVARSFGAAD